VAFTGKIEILDVLDWDDDDVVSVERLSGSLLTTVVVVKVDNSSSIRCIVSFCFMFNSSSSFCAVIGLLLFLSLFDRFALFLRRKKKF